MKTPFTLSFLFIAIVGMSQAPEMPRKEFVINLSESELYVKPGESKQITLSVVRSKYYAKEKAALGFSSALPKEVTATYESAEGKIETSVVTITASSAAAVGAYQIVLNATLNHLTKGAILKVFVSNEGIASKE